MTRLSSHVRTRSAGSLASHRPGMLFADSGLRRAEQFFPLVSWLRPGGRVVMDDLVPLRPPQRGSPAADDLKRGFFASDSRLTWTKVVLPDLRNSLLVGTRRT